MDTAQLTVSSTVCIATHQEIIPLSAVPDALMKEASGSPLQLSSALPKVAIAQKIPLSANILMNKSPQVAQLPASILPPKPAQFFRVT